MRRRGASRLRRAIVFGLALATGMAGCSGPGPDGTSTPRPPREVSITVVDRTNQAPLARARVQVGGQVAATGPDGVATLTSSGGAIVQASADGFDSGTGTVPDEKGMTIALRPNVMSGRVTDGAGKAIVGVRVFVEGGPAAVETDAHGQYALPGVPERGTLIYKMPGYRLAAIPIDAQMTKDVGLTPFQARALYSPSAVFEGSGRLDAQLALVDRTEANAMVIDVKEAGGNVYWATDLPAAAAVGSVMAHPLLRLDELLPKLKSHGIYTIARMVVMKDNTLGKKRPELAVRNTSTGEPWRDYRGGIWLDPYNPGVAEYIAALARDLAAKGFDEVQLDYVRFFSDGDYSVAGTNLPNTQSFRLPAIRRLFRLVSDSLLTTRTFFSADVFPISFIATDDQGIGQRPEVIMPYVDYFSPMVYPSHYAPYTFGFKNPNDHPYDVIDKTLKIMNEERVGLRMVIRPWIQDFGFGSFPAYTAEQILQEMKAASDNGAQGWMIWNASARFTEDALAPPRDGEGSSVITSPLPSAAP